MATGNFAQIHIRLETYFFKAGNTFFRQSIVEILGNSIWIRSNSCSIQRRSVEIGFTSELSVRYTKSLANSFANFRTQCFGIFLFQNVIQIANIVRNVNRIAVLDFLIYLNYRFALQTSISKRLYCISGKNGKSVQFSAKIT